MCSGLCEIKDTGDSTLGSSDQPQNMGCSLLTAQKNSTNNAEKKISTLCISLSTTWHRRCSRLGLWSISNAYCCIARGEGTSFRATTAKCSHLFGSLNTLYCLFSIYIEFCRKRKIHKKTANLILNITAIALPEIIPAVGMMAREKKKKKEKIYCWNVSVLFHISLIRQNKKAITLGQENTGHGCWHSITADTYRLALWK